MGWSRGAELAQDIWEILEPSLGPDANQTRLALEVIDAFEQYDCDSMYECEFVRELLKYDEESGKFVCKYDGMTEKEIQKAVIDESSTD